jgi:hypothetical protein
MHRYTLNPGHSRHSPRSEVPDDVHLKGPRGQFTVVIAPQELAS